MILFFQKPFPEAYVAGWGAGNSQCDSNDFGPSPHTMCKFPFVYKGKTNSLSLSTVNLRIHSKKPNKIFSKNEWILFAGITHTRCTRMPTPSNDDPICKQFFNTMASQGIVLPGRKDAYSIVHWNNITVRHTKCSACEIVQYLIKIYQQNRHRLLNAIPFQYSVNLRIQCATSMKLAVGLVGVELAMRGI